MAAVSGCLCHGSSERMLVSLQMYENACVMAAVSGCLCHGRSERMLVS